MKKPIDFEEIWIHDIYFCCIQGCGYGKPGLRGSSLKKTFRLYPVGYFACFRTCTKAKLIEMPNKKGVQVEVDVIAIHKDKQSRRKENIQRRKFFGTSDFGMFGQLGIKIMFF
ncbi:hypothetical protein CAEBREN_21813 [Caenorhabditis brenneri]|uniref:Uncharacterized protein n=1 Tax=Caenorhabditis brenneri TaxID=135651 RepID=G0P2M1_CAEBE|nr:hypothetical protein CAEBREN_21813 [Caenorhabditis brenneri]